MKNFIFCLIALSMLSVEAIAQVKIQSPSQDIEVKIRKCQTDGDNVLIEFLLNNISAKDIKDVFYASQAFPSTAHDDEGGTYKLEFGSLAGESISSFAFNCKKADLPAGVPVKCHLLVTNVDPNASQFSLVKLNIYFGSSKKTLTIRNLPINKD